MKPPRSHEHLEVFAPFDVEAETNDLRKRMIEFTMEAGGVLAPARPSMPPEITNRARELWSPLFAIADVVGGDWPRALRAAALSYQREQAEGASDDLGRLLLADLKTLFADAERLTTENIIKALLELEDRPWVEAASFGPKVLAQLLRQFDIRPRNLRYPDGRVTKGYVHDWMMRDAFDRFL